MSLSTSMQTVCKIRQFIEEHVVLFFKTQIFESYYFHVDHVEPFSCTISCSFVFTFAARTLYARYVHSGYR